MQKNLFIVIDGMDGTGKTYMVNMLHNYLNKKDKSFRILTTREPTNGKYGREARKLLEHEKDPLSSAQKMLQLFIKDREEHLKNVIEPFLNLPNHTETNIVICDRYYYSTITFQHTQGIDLGILIEKNKGFRNPDIAFILDNPPEISLQRISKSRADTEKFEKLEFMKKLRKNFLELKGHLKDNIKIIDASGTLEEEFKQIKTEIDALLRRF